MTYELRPPERINLADQGDDGTGRSHLSHSALGTFLACEQRHYLKYEQRLEPAVTKPSLAMGRAFAEGLEHDSPLVAATFLRERAAEEKDAAGGSPWIVLPTDDEVDIAAVTAQAAVGAYLGRYGAHQDTREHEMRARIRNPRTGRYSRTHDLVGRVDAISPDFLTMTEDKFVSKIDHATIAQRLWLDRQVTIGCYLVYRTTGVEVQNVRYRSTLKPSIRRRQAESHEGYLARVAQDYADRPDFYLHTEDVTRTPDDFVRLEAELWEWVQQLRDVRRRGVWARNTGACKDWGGCSYIHACARENGWEHQYVERAERGAVQLPVAA